MAISDKLLENLVCPVTGGALTPMRGKKLQGLLGQLKRNELRPSGDVDWQADEVEGLLLTTDRKGAYPVIDGVAVLLADAYLPISK